MRTVARTRIFARAAADGGQFLAYEMAAEPGAELAMVLPVPVRPGSGEDALRFIDLTGSPRFFGELDGVFPQVPSAAPRAAPAPGGVVPLPAPLPVHAVGDFEASFVPTIADFARLDARFRFPAGIWDQLPGYRAYGFAVFKLKPGRRLAHPMAFSFPRADTSVLFFPTFHIHDGAIHRTAHFDHVLYGQADPARPLDLRGWTESIGPVGQTLDVAASKGLLAADAHAYKRTVEGEFQNIDVVIRAA